MAPYDNSLWFVETNVHPLLDIADKQPEMVNYIRPSFWSRFVELQRVMWETNAGLTGRHAYDSRPLSWPVLRRGINYWTKNHRQVYLLGNPFIWYGSLCAIFVYLGARAILMLRAKRGKKDFNDSTVQFYDQTAGFLTLGWAMHFLPFFMMHRQLFIHHYLPALYFSILLLAVLFDALTSGLKPKFRFIAAVAMVAVAFVSYATYAPITYATPWTKSACERSKVLKTWDLNCNDFPVHAEKHGQFIPSFFNHSQATGTVDLNLPQAGNHPFEQAPKVASASNSASSVDTLPLAHYADSRLNQADLPDGAVDRRPLDGTAQADAEAEAAPAVAQQADIQGMDQEGVEAVVLQGTASLSKQQTVSSTVSSPASTTHDVESKVDAAAEGVLVVADE